MKCPKCKLENPDIATRCDCGYDFQTKSVEKSYLSDSERSRKPSDTLVIIGWIMAILGGVIGILIACSIVYGKDKNNRLEYKFDEESRKNGKNMLIVAFCMFGFGIIIRILSVLL